MQTTVPTFPAVRTGEGDALPVIAPVDFVAFDLHVLDETLFVIRILQRFVDRLDEIQFPALTPQSGLILTGSHLLFLRMLLRCLQHAQTVGETDLVVDLPVLLEVCGILMQLSAALAAHAVDYQMVVEVIRVQMGRHAYLSGAALSSDSVRTERNPAISVRPAGSSGA